MSSRATIVADLGFGDSGKGTITDFLVRDEGARLVVRWNGGAQAGHTVVTDDGRSHTFCQLGAGSFIPGVRTHLAETVVVHPTALLVEARVLSEWSSVHDGLARLSIAQSARMTTPYHQAAGRLRELARGAARHGTVGVGVGETVRDAMEAGGDDVIRMRDLCAPDVLARKLRRAQERLRASVADLGSDLATRPTDSEEPRAGELLALPNSRDAARLERAVLDDDGGIRERWIDAVRSLASAVVPDDALDAMLRAGRSVLEGAQGALLDERLGFHPHTTWSDCTARAAVALLRAHGHDGEIVRLGVLRTYTTRHGEGPLPTEDAALGARLTEPHNADGGWQGRFRVGHLDLVLARYAIAESGGLDGLAITHCDRAHALVSLAVAYDDAGDTSLFVHDLTGRAVALRSGDLAHQERLGRALGTVRPVLEPIGAAAALPDRIATGLGLPLAVSSHGPLASHKRRAPRAG